MKKGLLQKKNGLFQEAVITKIENNMVSESSSTLNQVFSVPSTSNESSFTLPKCTSCCHWLTSFSPSSDVKPEDHDNLRKYQYDMGRHTTIDRKFGNEIRSKFQCSFWSLLYVSLVTILIFPFYLPSSKPFGYEVTIGPTILFCLTFAKLIYHFKRASPLPSDGKKPKSGCLQICRKGPVEKFFRSAAEVFNWQWFYDNDSMPYLGPFLIIAMYPCCILLLNSGWYDMLRTPYVQCGGWEFRISGSKCNNVPVGGMFNNFTVILGNYTGGPLLDSPQELQPIVYTTITPMIAYIFCCALFSFIFAWTSTEPYKNVVEHERQDLEKSFNAKNESYSQALEIAKNIREKRLSQGYNPANGISWRLFSLVIGLLTGLLLPIYLIIWYDVKIERDPSTIFNMWGGALVVTICMWLLTRSIHWVSLLYLQNYTLMVLLYHQRGFDFENVEEFKSWQKLRKFEITYTMTENYGLGQWTFAGYFIVCLLTVLLVTVRIVLIDKTVAALTHFGLAMMFLVSFYSGCVIFHLMKSAISIWEAQLRHQELLQQHKLDLRSKWLISEQKGEEKTKSGDWEKIFTRRIDHVDELLAYMVEYDSPPVVFGIAVKPSLFAALQGYIISSVTLTGVTEFFRTQPVH